MTSALRKLCWSFATLIIAETCTMTAASARGAAPNIMDSPGYQRRLQESRGYVTNQSGSILAPQPTPAPVPRIHKRRHRQ